MWDFSYIYLQFLACVSITGLLVHFYIQYAKTKNLMDLPNKRSSHQIPVPRGGGVCFIITFLVSIAIFTFSGAVSLTSGSALFLVGGGAALVGFFDDIYNISAKSRLIFHFILGIVLVYLAGYLAVFDLGWFTFDLGYFGIGFTVFMSVWLLNLYNFMDGIDGIAAGEAVLVASVGAIITFFLGDLETALISAVLACCVLGFLPFNFPRAKVFMGDSGSGFLGIVFAVLIVISYGQNLSTFWMWLILIGIFIVDATYTLIYRLLAGFKPHQAHRSHAYQKLAQDLQSHSKASLIIYAVNVFWLTPLAAGVAFQFISGPVGIGLAYFPILMLVWYKNAGR